VCYTRDSIPSIIIQNWHKGRAHIPMGQESVGRLLEAVGNATRVVILPHNDPDPDAIAASVALRHLLVERLRVEVHILYRGIIGRAENRAFVHYLGHPMRYLTHSDLQPPAIIALVDTQPGAGNNSLPPDLTSHIVIDHHPWCAPSADAVFADVRPGLGATSTILLEYLQTAGVKVTPTLATALFYGIKTDTQSLGRSASPQDVTAYFNLQSLLDVDGLIEIEHAQVPAEYFKSLHATLSAARIYDGIVVAYAGPMSYPDLAAEMADLLLRLGKTRWVICIGLHKAMLIMSVRCRHRSGNAVHLVEAAVGSEGTFGGHGAMAGGDIPLMDRKPRQLAGRLIRRALRYLKVPPDAKGQRLI
jgi:nanoRNase/pAp phosphatase (c-di-AMP/oligoRNAs hydrolase)